MKIHCIGSSSSGNCYVIESLGQYLIVELGCAFKEVLAAIDWRVEKVAGCLASHRPPRRPSVKFGTRSSIPYSCL